MDISELRKNWDALAMSDPLWAILTSPDKRGRRWDHDDFFQTGVNEIAAVMSYIESLGINIKRRRVLDFGCGVGRLTQPLAGYFHQVIGVDISPSMIELAERYNQHPENCSYLVNETDDLRCLDSKSFDFIYSSLTLQHIQTGHSKKYLREFLRVLSRQGLMIFELPSEQLPTEEKKTPMKVIKRLVRPLIPTGLLNSYRRRRYYRFPRIEMYGMKRDDVVFFLEENGGSIVDVRPLPRPDRDRRGWMGFRYCVTTD